LNFIEPN